MNIRRILPIEMNLVLRNLKDYVFQENISLLNDSDKPRCYFLDAASYDNLGDQAIALSMTYFLRDIFGEENVAVVNEIDLIRQFKAIKREIKSKDVIVLSGGGNMGDKYPRYEALRRKVIKSFPNNKIVIFPQTIDYTDDRYGRRELKKSIELYNKHKNLIICVREHSSYEKMNGYYNNIIKIPDIAFYLVKRINKVDSNRKYRVGVCLRSDKESQIGVEERNKIKRKAQEQFRSVRFFSTMCKESKKITSEITRRVCIDKILSDFSECEFIITDRLHGVIFSVLSNTVVVAVDNSNHKVSGVIQSVLNYVEGVMLCDYSEIFDTLQTISRTSKCSFDIENEYEELKRLLKE